jgi:hypothetical protein
MAKSSSVMELPPQSEAKPPEAKPQAGKVRKRRASSTAAKEHNAEAAAPSIMKPLLIGLGIGAAVTATALILGSKTQRGRASSRPTVTGMLAKAALFSLTRLIVQRAGSVLADKAALKAADVWAAHTSHPEPSSGA